MVQQNKITLENGATTPTELLSTFLDKEKVQIRDIQAVEAKIGKMKQLSLDKLMVISDFDHTLSRYHKDNVKMTSAHGLFVKIAAENNPEFVQKSKELYEKYLPIEFDPEMSMKEKIPYMEEWWRKSHELIIENKMSKEILRNAVKRINRIQLRDGCAELLCSLNQANVPIVIFSAGIGQIIEYVLEYQAAHKGASHECQCKLLDNVHIISNFMQFSGPDDICTSFTEPLIHTFNKDGSVVKKEAPFFHRISDRTSVLLLGDSLGDVHMDVGVEKETVILRIGFLNFNIRELLPRYLTEYDIVLIDDQTMDIPNKIVSYINAAKPNSMVQNVDEECNNNEENGKTNGV